ncbi:MAG: ABC transporter permease subunit [Chloroflexi bacterium]|nr:ABC transporter permease subunit [Chloroflexota bacterium]
MLSQRKRAETLSAFLFMAPATIIFIVFLIVPIFFAIYFSLTNWDGIRPLDQQEQRASGTVQFTNLTETEIVIPEGTEVRGRRLSIFQTTSEMTLPAENERLTEIPVEPLTAPGRLSVDLSEIPLILQRQIDTELLAQLAVDNLDNLEGGTAVFINNSGEELLIPAGTRINVLNPVVYSTTEEVTVPAGEGSVAEVNVRASADFSGRAGNIAREAITEIDDTYAEQVSVINERAISNGVNVAYETVGLDNYSTLLFDEGIRRQDFFTALKNTTYFVLGVVPAQTFFALILAIILNQRFLKGRGFFRTAFYFPSITSSVVISIIFMWMFTRSGLVNTIFGLNYNWLNDSGGVIHNFLDVLGIDRGNAGSWVDSQFAGLSLWDWISGPSVTLFTIMILNTWTTIGTMMVIYLAALQNIPSHLFEAAEVDGATRWQIFRHITVPMLAPTTYFVVTLGLIGTFQVFDQVYVISSGGPAKTTLTIAYIVYQNGFNNSQMGLASATALVLFVIIFTFMMIQRRITPETTNI